MGCQECLAQASQSLIIQRVMSQWPDIIVVDLNLQNLNPGMEAIRLLHNAVVRQKLR